MLLKATVQRCCSRPPTHCTPYAPDSSSGNLRSRLQHDDRGGVVDFPFLHRHSKGSGYFPDAPRRRTAAGLAALVGPTIAQAGRMWPHRRTAYTPGLTSEIGPLGEGGYDASAASAGRPPLEDREPQMPHPAASRSILALCPVISTSRSHHCPPCLQNAGRPAPTDIPPRPLEVRTAALPP